MFEKFGEFNSFEELNMAAEGFCKEGDIESLMELAKENGIDQEDAQDYVDGYVPELVTLSSAAYARLALQKRELIDTKTSAVEKMPLRVILTMVESMCTNLDMAAAVMQKGKKITEIYDEMKNEASKHKSGSMGISCGTDKELCDIIKAYYLETTDDLKKKIAVLYE